MAAYQTWQGIVRKLDSQICELQSLVDAEVTAINAALHEAWLRDGGCPRCEGLGLIMASDTGGAVPCPEPTCTAKTVGPDPGRRPSVYDWILGVHRHVRHPAIEIVVSPFRETIEQLKYKKQLAMTKTVPHKGDVVVVVKGRSVPIGYTGTVFWVGKTKTGYDRIGIKSHQNGSEDVKWTYPSNVEVII